MSGNASLTGDLILKYRRRWIRRKLLWRAFRSRWALRQVTDNRHVIAPDTILGFVTLRNEIMRLPYYLEHYRKLGVGHFFVVDNASDDGSAKFLSRQKDVSVWQTEASYRGSRFGVDWLNFPQAAIRLFCTLAMACFYLYLIWHSRKYLSQHQNRNQYFFF